MTYTINLSEDFVDNIIVQCLYEQKEQLKQDLKKVLDTGKGFVFSLDADEDVVEISNLVNAMNVVIKYFSVPN